MTGRTALNGQCRKQRGPPELRSRPGSLQPVGVNLRAEFVLGYSKNLAIHDTYWSQTEARNTYRR